MAQELRRRAESILEARRYIKGMQMLNASRILVEVSGAWKEVKGRSEWGELCWPGGRATNAANVKVFSIRMLLDGEMTSIEPYIKSDGTTDVSLVVVGQFN